MAAILPFAGRRCCGLPHGRVSLYGTDFSEAGDFG